MEKGPTDSREGSEPEGVLEALARSAGPKGIPRGSHRTGWAVWLERRARHSPSRHDTLMDVPACVAGAPREPRDSWEVQALEGSGRGLGSPCSWG